MDRARLRVFDGTGSSEERQGVNRIAAGLPWLLLAICVVLGCIAIYFLFVNQHGPAREPIPSFYSDLIYLFSAVVGAALGAVIVARRRRNPIGWIFIGVALFQVGEDVATGYAEYGLLTRPGSLPGALFFAWLSQWMWTPVFAGLLLALLLYPTGLLLSPRWRWVARLGLLADAVLLVSAALASEITLGGPGSPLTLRNPIGLIDTNTILLPIILPACFGVVLLALFASLLSLFIRFRSAEGDERQQLKWFTYAAALALVTEVVAGATLGDWSGVVQNLAFLLLPISIAIAVLKYRLYDIDLLINRTLVYIPLTAFLAGIFSASITLTQKLFVALTGATSDAATVMTTLIVVAAFDPLRLGLQRLVDRRFKEVKDPWKELKAFGEEVRLRMSAVDVEPVLRRLLNEAVTAFEARGGAVFLDGNEPANPFYMIGEWNGTSKLSAPVRTGQNGVRFGSVSLGERADKRDYDRRDHEALVKIAEAVAQAIEQDRAMP